MDKLKNFAEASQNNDSSNNNENMLSDMDVSLIHEELYWLMQFLGYVMADQCESGTTPTIPNILFTLTNKS